MLPLGVVAIAFAPMGPLEAARAAARMGFDHIDVPAASSMVGSPLPTGDRLAGWDLAAGCTCMVPRGRDLAWDDVVARLRACPGIRIEPAPGTVCGSVAAARAMVEAVPGLRLTVDTGHVAAWGEDPEDLLDLADHVQLRQAAPGRPQAHVDEGGAVDFTRVVARLTDLGYTGRLSVEYFDLPAYGWPLADPIGWSVALAERVRPLLTG